LSAGICSASTQHVIHSRTFVVSTAGMYKAVPQIRLTGEEVPEYVIPRFVFNTLRTGDADLRF